jgi:hypothetical protein
MDEKQTTDFLNEVACPLCGIALIVIALAFGADIAITIGY